MSQILYAPVASGGLAGFRAEYERSSSEWSHVSGACSYVLFLAASSFCTGVENAVRSELGR